VQDLMKQWILRIVELQDLSSVQQDTHTAIMASGGSSSGQGGSPPPQLKAVMTWPEDLSQCLAQQLEVVTTRIEGPPRLAAFKLMVATLSEFRSRFAQVLRAHPRPSVGVLCAVVNDYGRFADTLEELGGTFSERLEASADEAARDCIEREVAAFTQASRDSISGLVEVMCADVETGLADGLPLAWGQNNPATMKALEMGLDDYLSEIRSLLLQVSSTRGFGG
jgi:hypothetical protein